MMSDLSLRQDHRRLLVNYGRCTIWVYKAAGNQVQCSSVAVVVSLKGPLLRFID